MYVYVDREMGWRDMERARDGDGERYIETEIRIDMTIFMDTNEDEDADSYRVKRCSSSTSDTRWMDG